MGTGFVVGEGLIATNLHVIGEARPISVELSDGRKFDVQSVHASDKSLDLALLKIDAEGLSPLELGDSDALKEGQSVVALGNPHGLKQSVVSGVVSGRREIDGREMIQLALPIEPGNSGGPVLDAEGRVVGIVTMKSLVTENLGFAVAINSLRPLLEEPNPIAMSRWLTIGALDKRDWQPVFGESWRRRSGRIVASGRGKGFGGRALCVYQQAPPETPYEVAVWVKLDDEAGAAGLIFDSDEGDRHYGFYPSAGNLRLSRFEGPDVFSWQVLEEIQSEHYRPGEWNFLKVRVAKDRIQCFVNDEPVIESTDRSLAAGKVGLAKFRETQPEFKGFRLAKSIPNSRPSEEEVAAINLLLDRLPPRSEIQGEHLAPLSGHSAAGGMLRQRAEELARQAEELRRLAEDVHVRRVAESLAELTSAPEEKIDLLRGALLIARLDDEELDVEGYIAQVERMAGEIGETLPEGAGDSAIREALNRYFFKENGFHGARTRFYHRANSYLSRVIDDREGLPITLCVLYIELGRRLGLEMEGVNSPGHFIVRVAQKEGEPLFVDPYEDGKLLSAEEAARTIRDYSGREPKEEDYAAASKQDILVRMLENLLVTAQEEDDRGGMLRYLEALIAIDPEMVPERGLRAILRHQMGREAAAVADLDWFLENQPPGVDTDKVREMRAMFLRP